MAIAPNQAAAPFARHGGVPAHGAGPDGPGTCLQPESGIERVDDQGIGWALEGRRYVYHRQLPTRGDTSAERPETSVLLESPLGQAQHRRDELVEVGPNAGVHVCSWPVSRRWPAAPKANASLPGIGRRRGRHESAGRRMARLRTLSRPCSRSRRSRPRRAASSRPPRPPAPSRRRKSARDATVVARCRARPGHRA